MTVKLLTEYNLEFLSSKGAAHARLSLHLSKCHIVGNHMSRLKFNIGFCSLAGWREPYLITTDFRMKRLYCV